PALYQAWAKEHGLLEDARRPAQRHARIAAMGAGAGAAAASAEAALVTRPRAIASNCTLDIRNPPPGAIYLIDPTLRAEFQTLPLQAVCAQQERIEWRIDGGLVGPSTGSDAFDWPLAAGQHRVAARDARGRTAETTILVK